LTGCHTFKVAAVTSFHAEQCCHMLNENEAPVSCIHCSICQLPIFNTFVLVLLSVLPSYTYYKKFTLRISWM